jgi:hypothetical protein
VLILFRDRCSWQVIATSAVSKWTSFQVKPRTSPRRRPSTALPSAARSVSRTPLTVRSESRSWQQRPIAQQRLSLCGLATSLPSAQHWQACRSRLSQTLWRRSGGWLGLNDAQWTARLATNSAVTTMTLAGPGSLRRRPNCPGLAG